MPLGHDQHAITNISWYATHSDWFESTYSPTTNEDVNKAATDHQIESKLTTGLIYDPASGRTPVVSRFKKDTEALILPTQSAVLPPLGIIRLSMVVQVFFGFGDATGKEFRSIVAGTYNCAAKFSVLQTNDMG